MQFWKSPSLQHPFHFVRRLQALLCLAGAVAAMVAMTPGPPPQSTPLPLPVANPAPDAKDPKVALAEQDKKNDAVNAERKKQLAEDSAKLFQLATDLKAEVDKTNKDMLSLAVIRKAEEVERLARGLRVKMSTGGR